MALIDKLDFDDEGKRAAFLPLRLADDVTAEPSDQLTADVQPKSNSACIYFLSLLEKAIHFEQFRHVFLSDTNASVRDTDLQKIVQIQEPPQRMR